MTTVEVDRTGVLTFLIDSPESKNALSLATLEQLASVLETLDPTIRAVVLAASGTVFSSGADLREVDQPGFLECSTAILSQVLLLIDQVDAPVVARVNGPAFGSGLAIVATADISVAVSTARFGLPEVRYGMVGAPAAAACRRRIGETALLDLMLTARTIDATEAHRIGLVSAVVPGQELDVAISEHVEAILAGDPAAVGRTKHVVRALA
jgi:methylglutaconyl-CoA hydratase